MLTLSTYQNLLLEMFGIGSVQELKKSFIQFGIYFEI